MDKDKSIDKTIWAIIGIGAVSYGAMFLYVYKATRQITFAVDGVSVENFNKKGITLGVYINSNNAGNRTLVIDDVDLDLWLNTINVGKLILPFDQVIGTGKTRLTFTVYIPFNSAFGNELWRAVQSISTYKANVQVSGKVKIQGMFVPIPQMMVASVDVLANIKSALNSYFGDKSKEEIKKELNNAE